MIVFCEDCGKKYRVDPTKIIGRAASFKCRACGHQILVSKPDPSPADPSAPQPAAKEPKGAKAAPEPRSHLESKPRTTGSVSAAAPSAKEAIGPTVTGAAGRRAHKKPERSGLRAKMLLLFFFIPMVLMAGAGVLCIRHFETTTDLLTRENSIIASRMAEEKIGDLAAAVARQCELYLLSHPELMKENFNKDPGFRSLAVQKVGQTGYTALYQLPESEGVWRIWAHTNSKFVGIDMSRLKQSLGRNFAEFSKIYSGVRDGRPSQGYYARPDQDAKFREKFMVCTPIAGTHFVIAATVDRDEITKPARMMASNAKKNANKTRNFTLAVLGAALILIGLVTGIYSYRLSKEI